MLHFLKTLLLEALKANRCDYVRVLLAKGVMFEKDDLPELYRQVCAMFVIMFKFMNQNTCTDNKHEYYFIDCRM